MPIKGKESYRWLENLRQATALLGEPERCVHIGDRESDIYELFCEAHDLGTHFLVRTCVDRLAGDGEHTIADEMTEAKIKGVSIVLNSAIRKAVPTKLFLGFDIAALPRYHLSTSNAAIPSYV